MQKSKRLLMLLVAALLIGAFSFSAEAKKRRKARVATPAVDQVPEVTEPAFEGIRLKLSDGTYLKVDEAWESEQGIWYRQGGISNLATRERVLKIERSTGSKAPVPQPVAIVKEPNPSSTDPAERPAWIYLKGGARFEADSVAESTAGVWYRRGPLSVFIDRARIDRVEREDLESLAKSESSSFKDRGWSTGSQKLDSLIRHNGARYGVDPYLIFCVMEQESHFNARAVSPKGARGLMQLMPGTAARFGVRNSHDPAQNIAAGTRYLKILLNQFNGRVDLVLAGYNAGEGAVMKFGNRVPPYRETQNYVKRIGYRYRRGLKTAAANHAAPPAKSL